MKKFLILLTLTTIVFIGCNDDNPQGPDPDPVDNFDRKAMLTNWADNIIMPAYADFVDKTESLQNATQTFGSEANQTNLDNVRTTWLDAYLAWQRVTMFLYVKGDELNLRLMMNIYPTDTEKINKFIKDGGYNLSLNSNIDKQGFPALDYMLYGLADNDTDIMKYYTTDAKAAGYRQFLLDLATRIHDLATEVNDHWVSGGFRNEFVNNDGSSVNASANRVVNDFIFYYEKDLRAGKVGIPIGIFSDNPLPDRVEAVYREDVSKALLNEALDAAQDFFNGTHHGSSTDGIGLDDYLDELNSLKEGADLTTLINSQFDKARTEIDKLGDNFHEEIMKNPEGVLEAYTQLQLNVVLLKTDMLQALNINTDFVDSDGD